MDYEKLTNPEHYTSHAVTVEPIFWCESLCEIPTLQKAAKEPSALKFFRRLFNSCVEKLCSLGLSQDEIWENIKYNEDAYRRLFGNGNAGAFTVAHSFA